MPSGLASSAALAPGYGSFPARPQLCAPPKGFRPAEGLRSARAVATGPFGRGPAPLRGTAAQKAGLRYERKVLARLGESFDGLLLSPWFEFIDATSCKRFCQPDALWLSGDRAKAILFEVKIRCVSKAWYQLTKLYTPVVQKAFGVREIESVVLCKSFDPASPFPASLTLLDSISPDCMAKLCGQMGVFVWRL